MPDEYILTVLDTPGIQRYIFGSNRLRENVGASHLVHLASTRWPMELLRKAGRSNVREDLTLDDGLRIEETQLDAEVIYVGGGNVVVLFREEVQAKAFVREWSRKIITEAPGLTPAAVHWPYRWGENLSEAIDAAMKALKQARQSRPPSTPLLGLGVTVEGSSTGKPAVAMSGDYGDPRHRPVSAEVAAKLGRAREANERLRSFLPKEARTYGYDFPLETDQLGRSEGEMSYLAIVHADGNGVGDYFRRIKQESSPRAYIEKIREASRKVEQVAEQAQRGLLTTLLSISPNIYRSWGIQLDKNSRDTQVQKEKQTRKEKLPFRPIVFGGDDFTFISDGRLGLTLAARYLELFEDAAKALGLPLKASAGIAIVKVHYPFARAYRLSEALTASAKRYAKACGQGEEALSAMDWHFAPSGLLGELDEIQEREYRTRAGWLLMRPILLRETPKTWRTWPNFLKAVEHFKKEAQEHRNKVIALRIVLREGKEAVRNFLATTDDFSLPKLQRIAPVSQATGWNDARAADCAEDHIPRTPYFDAIEAMDFYQPLHEVEREGNDDDEDQA